MGHTLDVVQDSLSIELVGDILKVERGRLVISHELQAFVVGVVQSDGAILELSAREVPREEDDGDNEKGACGDDTGDEWGVDLLDRPFVTWDFGVIQTLSRATAQLDATVADQGQNQVVHGGLFEGAIVDASILLQALELCRALDLLYQEFANVDGAVLATEHAVWNAVALDLVTLVVSAVLAVVDIGV